MNPEERLDKLYAQCPQCPQASIVDNAWLDIFVDFAICEYHIMCEAYDSLMDEKTGMSRIQYLTS